MNPSRIASQPYGPWPGRTRATAAAISIVFAGCTTHRTGTPTQIATEALAEVSVVAIQDALVVRPPENGETARFMLSEGRPGPSAMAFDKPLALAQSTAFSATGGRGRDASVEIARGDPALRAGGQGVRLLLAEGMHAGWNTRPATGDIQTPSHALAVQAAVPILTATTHALAVPCGWTLRINGTALRTRTADQPTLVRFEPGMHLLEWMRNGAGAKPLPMPWPDFAPRVPDPAPDFSVRIDDAPATALTALLDADPATTVRVPATAADGAAGLLNLGIDTPREALVEIVLARRHAGASLRGAGLETQAGDDAPWRRSAWSGGRVAVAHIPPGHTQLRIVRDADAPDDPLEVASMRIVQAVGSPPQAPVILAVRSDADQAAADPVFRRLEALLDAHGAELARRCASPFHTPRAQVTVHAVTGYHEPIVNYATLMMIAPELIPVGLEGKRLLLRHAAYALLEYPAGTPNWIAGGLGDAFAIQILSRRHPGILAHAIDSATPGSPAPERHGRLMLLIERKRPGSLEWMHEQACRGLLDAQAVADRAGISVDELQAILQGVR